MHFLLGTRSSTRLATTILLPCQRSGIPSLHRLQQVESRRTVLLLPVGQTHVTHRLGCDACASETEIDNERAAQLMRSAALGPAPLRPRRRPSGVGGRNEAALLPTAGLR